MEFLFFLCKWNFRVLFVVFFLLLESTIFFNNCIFFEKYDSFYFFVFLKIAFVYSIIFPLINSTMKGFVIGL
jgi:hypothetical protein